MSLNKPIYKLRDWIDINKLNWNTLNLNNNAFELLKKYYPEIISFLENNSSELYEKVDIVTLVP